MRIKVILRPQEARPLPWHYNAWLQGVLYRALGPQAATFWHDQGFADGARRLKLFAFSRLLGPFARTREGMLFRTTAAWFIASPADAFLEQVALGLLRQGQVHIGPLPMEVVSVEVLPLAALARPLRLKALSPITVYSTLETREGRKKTYYYAPQEPEFGGLVLENLRRKIRAWTGQDIPPDGATFRPARVSNRNLVVARYKGTVVKGWTGIYELDAPEPYLRMALDAGLGAKNSQGFGFVEVWEKQSHGDRGSTEEKSKITQRHGEHREN